VSARVDERLHRLRIEVEYIDRVAGLQQVVRHRRAHVTEPDKAYFHDLVSVLAASFSAG
jgi:hypothetical protein